MPLLPNATNILFLDRVILLMGTWKESPNVSPLTVADREMESLVNLNTFMSDFLVLLVSSGKLS